MSYLPLLPSSALPFPSSQFASRNFAGSWHSLTASLPVPVPFSFTFPSQFPSHLAVRTQSATASSNLLFQIGRSSLSLRTSASTFPTSQLALSQTRSSPSDLPSFRVRPPLHSCARRHAHDHHW